MALPALSHHGRAGFHFIGDEGVIEKILKHLGHWDLKFRPPSKVRAPSVTISIDDSDFQVPFSAASFFPDPDYPIDSLIWWGHESDSGGEVGLPTRGGNHPIFLPRVGRDLVFSFHCSNAKASCHAFPRTAKKVPHIFWFFSLVFSP